VYLGLIRLQAFTVKQMVNLWRASMHLSARLMRSNCLTKEPAMKTMGWMGGQTTLWAEKP
jgi:hypothetical protein